LPFARASPTFRVMESKGAWRRFIDHPVTEWAIFGVGVILILLSPVVGALPGPGGVIVFALGLALVLKTSRWARRRYVRFKRWQPKAGRWTDWGLRRKSAARREALRKELEARHSAGDENQGPPSASQLDNRRNSLLPESNGSN
jgi:hypothetical protein